MIEVIGPPEGHKKVRCDRCLHLLKYAPIDVKEHEHFDYGGGSDTVRTIVCPKCQNKVVVG